MVLEASGNLKQFWEVTDSCRRLWNFSGSSQKHLKTFATFKTVLETSI